MTTQGDSLDVMTVYTLAPQGPEFESLFESMASTFEGVPNEYSAL